MVTKTFSAEKNMIKRFLPLWWFAPLVLALQLSLLHPGVNGFNGKFHIGTFVFFSIVFFPSVAETEWSCFYMYVNWNKTAAREGAQRVGKMNWRGRLSASRPRGHADHCTSLTFSSVWYPLWDPSSQTWWMLLPLCLTWLIHMHHLFCPFVCVWEHCSRVGWGGEGSTQDDDENYDFWVTSKQPPRLNEAALLQKAA